MASDPFLVALRFLHVLSGVFWAGAAFVLAGFVVRGPERSSEADGRFIGQMMLERRLSYTLVISAVVAIGSGVGLFRKFFAHAKWDWSHPAPNEAYAIGFFAAAAAFLVMIGLGIPVGMALRRCRNAIDATGGRATQPLNVEHARLVRRNAWVWRSTAALLFVTVTTMAVGRYIF
ncbi:MAG: hypothetical protein ABI625_05500 [bacterium]